jgi:hypothetical protein
VYDAPAGFTDLLADAEAVPVTGEWAKLAVRTVGEVLARRPGPRAAAALAVASNPKATSVERTDHLVLFVRDHLADGEYERLLVALSDEQLPLDAVQQVARSLAVWGTARPYTAVLTLCVLTGRHWRTIRMRMLANGITDPLGLRSLHALLDSAEALALESQHDEKGRAQFLDSLYAPLLETRDLNGPGYRPVPAGFSPEEQDASFEAFRRLAR